MHNAGLLAWDMPLNDMLGSLSGGVLTRWGAYPDYMLAVFVLPLFYGAWRFVLFHALLGPILVGSARPVHVVTQVITVRGLVNMSALTVAQAALRSGQQHAT